MKDLEIYNHTDDLIQALAETIREVSENAIAQRGVFNFVLAGGNSPRRLYKLLASKAYKNRIDWKKTYFFFGDERYVPLHDPKRNSLMAEETLFRPLKIKESHVFKVDTTGSPEDSAHAYAHAIATHFNKKPIVFDFILLGLGDDAHTASLFPHTSVLEDTKATVKSVFVESAQIYRITMTAALINQAENIAFLVYGKEKSDAVYHVLKDQQSSPLQYPAKLIRPKNGSLHWFLDTEAFMAVEQSNNTNH